jgi:hypothetical protein
VVRAPPRDPGEPKLRTPARPPCRPSTQRLAFVLSRLARAGTPEGHLPPHLVTTLTDAVGVIELHGEHDLATLASLCAAVGHVLDRGASVVVDVSAARFLDVASVSALAQLRPRDGSAQRIVLQVDPGCAAEHVLDLLDARRLFVCASGRSEALRLATSAPTDGRPWASGTQLAS